MNPSLITTTKQVSQGGIRSHGPGAADAAPGPWPNLSRLSQALSGVRQAVLQLALGREPLPAGELAAVFARDILCARELAAPMGLYGADPARELAELLPEILGTLLSDVSAACERDPAASGPLEVILCYPGFEAVCAHRVAHALHRLGLPLLPRVIAELARSRTGIDIHPAAVIGRAFFIDHGSGVVIGATCRIADHVTLYQGVTLGALGFPLDASGRMVRDAKRHPTLEEGVTVYAHALILGGATVVGRHSVIGAQARIIRSVPPYSKIPAGDK